jgi:hypothetical protein
VVGEVDQIKIEENVVYHLKLLKEGFDSGILNEETIFNVDETHLLVDERKGRIYGISGEEVRCVV